MTLTTEQRATNNETFRHIERVRNLLNACIVELLKRGELHDQSKLESPEVEVFTEFTPMLEGLTYGSTEYKDCLAAIKPALDHHYANNRHHPEHFDSWKCPDCDRIYTRADVPEVGYEGSSLRWCLDCYDGKYPGYFETVLIKTVSINAMNLIDLIEMFCDWKAASERHEDGDIYRSISINADRFNMTPQLQSIFTNTAGMLAVVD